jgi:23S rRNA pseudouridine1911/1915/1917 synthase
MLRILHEEQRFLVVLKPAGILTHSTGRGEEKALADFVAEKYPEIKKVGDVPTLRPGVVHRLDKDTSGIILFARTQDFFEYLKKCFQEGKIEKTYMALI